jgi:hypothetical protein
MQGAYFKIGLGSSAFLIISRQRRQAPLLEAVTLASYSVRMLELVPSIHTNGLYCQFIIFNIKPFFKKSSKKFKNL